MSFPLKNLLNAIICPEKNWKVFLLYNWHDIMGDLQSKVRIEKIYDDTLVLGVIHSSWMQELYLLSPLIIKTINEKLEHPHIKQLRFKHMSHKKRVIQKRKSAMFYKKDVQLTKKDEYILEKIGDPMLKEALKNFRMRCYRESS